MSLSPTASLVIRPALTGILGGLAASMLIPYDTISVPLLDAKVNTMLLFGAVGAGSNLLTGAITQNLLPKITSNPMVLNNTMVVEPVVAGLTNVALVSLIQPGLLKSSDVGLMKIALAGAGAEIAADYGSKYLQGMY